MGRFTDTITQLFPQAEQPPLDPAAEARVRTANPDNVATAQKLASEIGLDARVVERNLEEVQQRHTVGRFQQFLREHPEAVALGAEFGAVAKDDVGPLSRIAAAIKSGALGGGAGLLTTLGAIPERLQQRFPMPGFIQGEDGKIKIVSGTEYNRIVAERRAAGQVSDVSDFFMFAGQRGAERAEAAGREAAIPELREIDSPAKFLEFGGLHLAQSLPYMLLARTSPTLVAGSIGGNVLEERVGDGEVTDQDVMIAMSAGIVSGLLEKYGADKVLGAIPNLSSTVARRIGTATVAEAATEFAQEGFVEYVGETLGISEFDFDEALYRGVSGALAGGFSGGSIRSSVEALVAVAGRSTKERVDANADMLKKLASAAEASALRERNPEQFKQYVDTLAPDTDIYFDAADAEALLQSSVLEETELPDDLEARIAEAAEHDTPVRISAAEYATYFADAHTAQALSLRARVGSATAMNVDEAKNIESEFAQRAEAAILAAEDAEAMRADARQVREQVLAQIMSTGRFRQDVATTYATLVENFFVAMAARAGTTPGELFARYPLRVQAVGTTDPNALDQPAKYEVEQTVRGPTAQFEIGEQKYVARLHEPNPASYFTTSFAMEVAERYGSEKPALELDFGAGTGPDGTDIRFEGKVEAPSVAKLMTTLIAFAQEQLAKAADRVVMIRAPIDSQDQRLRIYERGLRRNIRTHDVRRFDDETLALVPRAEARPEPALNQAALRPVATLAKNAGDVPQGFTRFRHFGRYEVSMLDPQFMGTGMRGEERRRNGPRVISLYPDKGFQKESGVGNVEYVVDVPSSQLYDASADPLKLADEAQEVVSYGLDDDGRMVPRETRFDMDAFERAIERAGFVGYTTPGAEGNLRGQARLFTPVPVTDAMRSVVEETADLFQLAPEKEPIGFDAVKPYLTDEERNRLMKNSAQKLVDVFNALPKDADFEAAAQAGAAKRGWYASAVRTLRQVFGDADAPRFAALLAATSPQVSVQTNLQNAAAIWVKWDAAGRPTDPEQINAVINDALGGAQSVLGAWRNNTVRALSAEDPYGVTLSGPKVNSFMRNLMGDVQEVTNDTWMANFAAVNQILFKGDVKDPAKSGPGKRPGYVAYAAKIRKVAKNLTKKTGELWTPAEVQETIWSWAKTAYELAEVAGETRSVEELVRAGEITDARVAGADDFASMLKNNESIRNILEAAGYGEAIEAIEVEFGREQSSASAARPAITPALLRSARRLDEVRRQRAEESERGRAEPEEVQGEAPAERDASTPLSGLPDSSPGPIPAIRQIAERYVNDILINKPTIPPQVRYVRVNETRAKNIARAYEAAKHDPNDFEVAVAYDALIDETLAQFQLVKELGINIEFIEPGQADPYPEGPRQVLDDLRNGHLWVFPTDQGFGQSEAPGHPLLRPTDEYINGRQLLANDVFRIVHDVFGHGKEGVGFGPTGEENAWHAHVRMYSPLAARAMTSETRGQNSWVNFGPHGEANRKNQKQTVYAEQKATLLPDEIVFDGVEEGSGGGTLEQSPREQAALDRFLEGSKAPRVLYHGTKQDITAFTTKRMGAGSTIFGNYEVPRVGIFMAESPELAAEFATQGGKTAGARTMPLHANIAAPLDMDARGYSDALFNSIKAEAQKLGLDGYRTARFVGDYWGSWELFDEDRGWEPEKFVQILKNLGYDGAVITERSEGDVENTRTWVAFDPAQVKSAVGNSGAFDPSSSSILEQGEAAAPRGQITMGRDLTGVPSIVTLFEAADLTTFLHESGHFFFEVMADMAARPDAAPAIRADMETLLRWVKFEGTVEQWRDTPIPQRREAHEKFARGFEAWLMEGTAPNEEMRGLFHRFRAWLINIYKSVAQLNVELTDEVRTVMSHMVATDAQIAAAQAARNYAPLFDSAQAAGMTPEEWQAYQDTTRAATEHAQDALQARSMRNLRWLDNARARELKKLQAANKAKRDAIRAEVEAEVAREPARVAETFLLTGKAWVENLAGEVEEVTVEGPHKLSVAALGEAYGTREEYQAMAEAAGLDAKAARAPWEGLPRSMLSKDGGLSADEVAELTGFRSGDQLIAALLALPNREQVIEQETNRRVMERYGDLTNPQALARAVDMAVHNQHRTRVVAMELQALDESLKTQPGGIATVRRAARDYAQKVVQRLRIRDVRPNQYLAAESKAARESRAALAAGDLKLAATRKRDQLFNGYASRDANRALELIDKGLRYLKRFQDPKIRARLDPAYRDQIDKLLERYDLKRRSLTEVDKRTSLAEWIKEQEAQGNDPIIPDELRDESKRTNYQNLTVEQFTGLVDSVKNIEHLANLKRKLLAAKEQRDFDTAVEQLVASINENSTGQLKEQLEKDLSLWGRFADTVNEWFMHLRKMASVVRQIDGVKDGGRMWEYFMRPINAASDKEVAMRADATRRLSKLLDSLPALRTSFVERLGRKVTGPPKLYIPEIDQALSLEARLAVALNWGNEGNRERIREGNRWTDAQIEAVINTLTKEEMDFVQGVWNFIGSYWDEIASKEERVTGVRPVRVEPTPVITRHGTYEGGYYPIVADPGRSERAAQLNDAELIGQSLRGAVTRATTRRGHTKARVGGKDPVRLDLGVITQHVSQVIHDLSWHEVLIDLGRLLRDKRVSQALRDNYGAEVTRLMRKTLDDVARGEVHAQDAGERLVNYFRVGSTVAGLAFSVTTALLQPTGITQSMVRVGYRHVARGLLEFMARPAQSIKKVREASTFMRDRGLLLNRELGEITNKLDGQPLGLARFYFLPIQALQTAVDVPTWIGAYNKAFGEGETHERAVALADQAVRDSQSTGAISDLAEAQRGGAWKKLWTNFYSYFSATYQLSAESVQTFKRDKSLVGAAKMASDFIMLYTVPAVLGYIIREGLRGDLDDDDPEEVAEALLKAQLSYMLGVFPYVREVAGAIEGFDYQGPGGANIIAQLGQMGAQIAQGENDEALWRSINRAAGTAFHYPAAQVDRTVRGMIAVAEGEAGPQAILVGPPAKKE